MYANDTIETAMVWYDEREGGGWVTRITWVAHGHDEGTTVGMVDDTDRDEDPRDALVAAIKWAGGPEVGLDELVYFDGESGGYRWDNPEA